MKHQLLIFIGLTAIVAGTAFGLTYWLRCQSCVAPHINLAEVLQLTDSQAAAVTKLEAAYQQRLGEICVTHCAARADLAAELGRPTVNATKAQEFCQQMCAAQSASERLTLEHVIQIRALLTPDQQQQHAALVQNQLSKDCPMRARPTGN